MASLAALRAAAEAESVQQKAQARRDELAKERLKYAQAAEGPFASLVEGRWSTETEQQKLLGKLTVTIATLGAEHALLESIPEALAVKPPAGASRSPVFTS